MDLLWNSISLSAVGSKLSVDAGEHTYQGIYPHALVGASVYALVFIHRRKTCLHSVWFLDRI